MGCSYIVLPEGSPKPCAMYCAPLRCGRHATHADLGLQSSPQAAHIAPHFGEKRSIATRAVALVATPRSSIDGAMRKRTYS